MPEDLSKLKLHCDCGSETIEFAIIITGYARHREEVDKAIRATCVCCKKSKIVAEWVEFGVVEKTRGRTY